MLKNTLRGTGVALVTPFKNQEIDFPALGKLIDFVIENGVNYVVTLGTTGETPTLSATEKKDIIAFTYEHVNNRVPVIVGIGGNDTKSVCSDLEKFDLSKATAVLSASPYYNKPTQEGLFLHYKTLAAASPLPLLLYNVPGRTGRNMTAGTTIKLANEVPNIVGIKEASDDMNQCMELLRDCPKEFLIVSGDDALTLPQLACGFDGVISVAANCFPKAFSSMVQHALNGELIEARKLHYNLLEGYNLLFKENNPAGVKGFLHALGILKNELRLPLTPATEQLMVSIRKYLS
ncbi:MAG: 4-hydroxy-tetrahydrodipicolinate synthase [Hydrotalea sp.]|nr:4-hydroxy-tetrahydrodipicolinate synthase [Hydrotalea sp.]